MKKLLLTMLASFGILFAGWTILSVIKLQDSLHETGSFYPTGGGTYRLQTSIGTTDTSVNLSSFKEPISGIPYTMTYLNTSIAYGTLDPQNSSRKEFISFTGVTQNSDGTAQLTGVTRGLGFSYPYTASSTLRSSHAGQSIFILSDSPQLFNEYLVLRNTATSTGVLIFSSTTPPQYDANITVTGNQLVSANQLNATAIAGAGTSTYSSMGIVQLAGQTQVGSSTASSTAGGPLVIPNIFATTTPGTQCTTGKFRCVVSTALGKISQSFFDLASSWAFTGPVSIAASSGNNLTLNSIAYAFPTAQGAASSTPMNDGSGNLKWAPATVLGFASTSLSAISAVTATSTFFSTSIPANILVGNNTLHVHTYFSTFNVQSGKVGYIYIGYGYATTTISITDTGGAQASSGVLDVYITSTGANTQRVSAFLSGSSGASGAVTNFVMGGATGTSNITATSPQDLVFQVGGGPGTTNITPVVVTGEYIR